MPAPVKKRALVFAILFILLPAVGAGDLLGQTVGKGGDQCLWGDASCDDVFECLWGDASCTAEHLWGSSAAEGWEVGWEPSLGPGTVLYTQSFEVVAGTYNTEVGVPAAASSVGAGAGYQDFNWTGAGLAVGSHAKKHTAASSPAIYNSNSGAWTASLSGVTYVQFAFYQSGGTGADTIQLWRPTGWFMFAYFEAVFWLGVDGTTDEVVLIGCDEAPSGTISISESTLYWVRLEYITPGYSTLEIWDNGTPKSLVGSVTCHTGLEIYGQPTGFLGGRYPGAANCADVVFDHYQIATDNFPAWP